MTNFFCVMGKFCDLVLMMGGGSFDGMAAENTDASVLSACLQ